MSQLNAMFSVFCLIVCAGCTSEEGIIKSSDQPPITLSAAEDTGVPIDFAALVKSLRNANPEPEILGAVKVEFDERYDFREQRRIRKVIETLMIYAEEAWPELVENFDSKPYCYTFGFGESAVNYTVGEVCEQLIRNNLSATFIETSVILDGSDLTLQDLYDPDLLDRNKLKSWLAERPKTSLVELQLQTLKTLCRRIPNMKIEESRKSMLLEALAEAEEYLKVHEAAIISEWLIPLERLSTYLTEKRPF